MNEYLQFLNIALGSCGELMTRSIGLLEIDLPDRTAFEQIDKAHYSVENELVALVKSLQLKTKQGGWMEDFDAGKEITQQHDCSIPLLRYSSIPGFQTEMCCRRSHFHVSAFSVPPSRIPSKGGIRRAGHPEAS